MQAGHEASAEALLDRFSLLEHGRKLGSELSKGMAQKLNICLGLFRDPSVLLLDEPFIGLDPHAIKELKRAIASLAAAGATLLVSTHIIESVDLLFDRALVMSAGHIVEDVTRRDLGERGLTLEELFFGATEGAAPEADA